MCLRPKAKIAGGTRAVLLVFLGHRALLLQDTHQRGINL
jgi:hypothetical protein